MQVSRCVFNLFGTSVKSEYDFDLPPASGPGQIEVVFSSVEEEGDLLFQTNDPLPFACYKHGNAVVLAWTDVRFRITPDRVVVDSEDPVMAAQLLIPAAWSVVLSAHERESLHGAAVDCNGRAIAILGFSGSGKTTAARRLIENGCSLISDDLLTFDDDLRVIPGPPWMRLDPCPGNEEESVLDAGGKMRIYPPVRSTPSPLSAMVIMAPEYTHFVRLSGTAAASALFQQVYNPVLTHSNQVERRFDLVLDLVDRVPVFGAAPRSLSADLLLRAGKESIA